MSTLSFFSWSSDNVEYHFHFYVSKFKTKKLFLYSFCVFLCYCCLLQTKFRSFVSYTIPTSLWHFQSFTRIPQLQWTKGLEWANVSFGHGCESLKLSLTSLLLIISILLRILALHHSCVRITVVNVLDF